MVSNKVIEKDLNSGKVSVVVTTYKRDIDTLKACLDSIKNQSYKNMEIILVDDNSDTDSFRREIEACIGAYDVHYIKHSVNLGAQHSRNDGIKAAKGEFVAFLDDDDTWECTKLARQLPLFEGDNIGLVFCNGNQITMKDHVVSHVKDYRRKELFQPEYSFKDLLFSDYIGATSQVVVRRTVFDTCGMFDPDQQARQDYEMWLRISRSFRCVGIEHKLFNYMIHEGEQISKSKHKVLSGYKNIYKKYKKHYQLTSKAHLMRIFSDNYVGFDQRRSQIYKCYSYVLYFLACIFDRKEFSYRMMLNKQRSRV